MHGIVALARHAERDFRWQGLGSDVAVKQGTPSQFSRWAERISIGNYGELTGGIPRELALGFRPRSERWEYFNNRLSQCPLCKIEHFSFSESPYHERT